MPNVQAIVDQLRVLADQYPEVTALALQRVMYEILTESKKMCPVKTGYLRGSGYFSYPTLEPERIHMSIGYTAEYAWWVHENLEVHHPAAGTKAKFLEEPLQMYSKNIPEAVHREVNRLLGI